MKLKSYIVSVMGVAEKKMDIVAKDEATACELARKVFESDYHEEFDRDEITYVGCRAKEDNPYEEEIERLSEAISDYSIDCDDEDAIEEAVDTFIHCLGNLIKKIC